MWSLYENRQDSSVLMVARFKVGETPGYYECRRYGEEETFTLDAGVFLSIYRKRKDDQV